MKVKHLCYDMPLISFCLAQNLYMTYKEIIFSTLRFFLKSFRSRKLNKEQFEKFQKFSMQSNNDFIVNWKDRYLIFDESTKETSFDRHYVYHPAWAARVLYKTNPSVHYDFSSILYFGAIISSFISIKFFDYRPADLKLDNYSNDFIDLTNLKFGDNSIESLSCMHTVEHIGLGRYGDEIDAFADRKAMKELARVIAPSGNFLFVVPVAAQNRVVFNAHRVYNVQFLIDFYMKEGLKLVEFVLIPENQKDGGLVYNPPIELLENQNYGCGCFWFTK